MMPTDYAHRQSLVQAAMQENGLDALVITPGAAMLYLTGFSEPGSRFLALIVSAGKPWAFVVPALNAGQARLKPGRRRRHSPLGRRRRLGRRLCAFG